MLFIVLVSIFLDFAFNQEIKSLLVNLNYILRKSREFVNLSGIFNQDLENQEKYQSFVI